MTIKYLNQKVASVGIFFASALLLITYLLSVRWDIHMPIALFWVAVTLIIGTVIYQVVGIKLSSGYTKVILLEIVVICLLFHLLESY